VVIDVSMSLDGFIAGPHDGRELPLGGRGGEHVFDWYFGGERPYRGTMFKPKGPNRRVVAEMFRRSGAMLTGRRTYEIAGGWGGTHPVDGIPVVIMTHRPPADPPTGRSRLVFVTDGIESAVARAKELAKGKDVGIGGASVAQQALRAGLVDELHLHVAPILLGDGVRLFEHLGTEAVRLRFVGSVESGDAVHLRYEVVR
jgi:dihydrofolate reductase